MHMSARDRLYISMVKELLGPRGDSSEVMDRDPRDEYVTGILEPQDYDRGLIENYGNSDIGMFVAEEEHEEDDTDRSNDFEISPANLDARALPKSMGLSFVINSDKKPLIDFCVTWARYVKEGDKWRRTPDKSIQRNIDVNELRKEVWRPSPGVRVVLRSIQLEDKIWHVSIYLVNETKIKKYPTTHDLIFQPQIRVHFHEGVFAIPVDRKRISGYEEKHLELLYSELQNLARGHMCGATWKKIDPERPFKNKESILIPDDIKGLPDEDRVIFINPDVRTEFLPSYSIIQSTVEIEDIEGMKKDDTDAGRLAEKWDSSALMEPLKKIVDEYSRWIESQKSIAKTLKTHKEIADENLEKCERAVTRINEGIKLLEKDDVRLAFCFMNKVMDLQSMWTRKQHLVWRPFQLAFILQCLPSIEDYHHDDRKKCDLLWYPTAGGKTEAYLGLMVFTLALRRLRKDKEGLSSAGTAIISRYTLRLLTIQQFRRTLTAITTCEYLRIKNWLPQGMKSSIESVWGTTRFSIGLWLGGDITPNILVDHTGWDNTRRIATRYVGAVGILKYSHLRSNRPGERVSFQGEEPAQVLKCPSCDTVLSVPSTGLSGTEHEIYWIIKADTKPQLKAAGLDYTIFTVRKVEVHQLPNPGYYVVQVQFTINADKLKDESIREWWRQHVQKVLRATLVCSAASRPGYFIREAPNVHRSPVDFEIHCPNPKCELNNVEWFEAIPTQNGIIYYTPLEPFAIPSKRNFTQGMIIPAYTIDAQVYARCPSIVIATVDKFARLPFEPRATSIFGNVNRYDDIWGYYRDVAPPDTGKAKQGNVTSVTGFVPPELIAQDELHLIEGPLGSMVGLYETAIDLLCTRVLNKKPVYPKYVASTATTRQASTQVSSLYNRELRQFPPPGITSLDNFFSKADEAHPLDSDKAGRLYVGVCSPGKGPQTPTARIWASLLQESERIRRQGTGKVEGDLEYFWMVVGYFNAIRELAAARSLYRQDIPEWMKHMDGDANARVIEDFNLLELHSNVDSAEIPAILDQLEKSDSAVDAVMATSMFGTGVDIDRLSLMIVHGQPKTTASYIQATGRVGRKKGALVVTFLRSTRPRDLDHYEFFTGYHRALHRYVEPVTVAPFSPRACDRGLGPVAVAILRNASFVNGSRINPSWAPESEYWKGVQGRSGSRIMIQNRRAPELQAIIDAIEERAQAQPANRKRPKSAVSKSLNADFDVWENVAKIEPSLFYFEPAFNYQPNNPVVLGDAQHVQNKKRVVFESTPQSMRDVESTTRFKG